MFSANENLALRQHKRRIVNLVEECIPDHALDAGTCVMVMQKTCNAPGCVPLETAIAIVFPRPIGMELGEKQELLIDGLEESAGGTYKTNVLKPMAEVMDDDVLDALPPTLGGRRDPVQIAFNVRDSMFGSIQQAVPDNDAGGKRILAEYLIASLREYIDNECVPPEFGKMYPSKESEENDLQNSKSDIVSGSIVNNSDTAKNTVAEIEAGSSSVTEKSKINTTSSDTENYSIVEPNNLISTGLNSAVAWKQKRKMDNSILGSSSIIQQIYEREHEPGIRRPGCPCCDPDDPSNILDKMMML